MFSVRFSTMAAFALSVAACGGNYVSGDDEGTDFGTDSSGGMGSGGGGNGSGSGQGSGGDASGGQPAGVGGGVECCLAAAICDPGDSEIASKDDCPENASCYENSACCSTIWCARYEPNCDAFPSCQSDEEEVSECAEEATCTSRELCGNAILCQKKEGSCDPDDEPDRNYVGESPGNCTLIDYTCPEHTMSFGNDCGCGCEQPSECPDFVNCAPGGTIDPLCDSDECPYTDKAF
jgi:hypothetical protein